MSSKLHFPQAETMTKYLSDHESLKMDYYQKKGITKAIAELAAKRLADSDIVEDGIEIAATLMINDLRGGKDRLCDVTLPNLSKLKLPKYFWEQLSTNIQKALSDCAN